MSEEKVEAKMEELGGNVKEAVGKVTGDKEVETEGQVDQLKGKVKESGKEKRQRKKEFAATKKQIYTIVIPTLIAIFIFIIVYVYIKTRYKQYID